MLKRMSVSASESDTTTAFAPPVLSVRQRNVVFGTIMLGMLLAALDQTIVSTALPTIVGDLGGATHVSWVVTSYLLTNTIATVLAGRFGDLFGRKRIFQLGAGLFVIASAMCGFADSLTWLIAWRAVQGIGAGALTVTAIALIGDIIPLRERGRYQGMLGAVFGVTTVIGPLLGGYFTDHLSWRYAFYVNLPLGILVVAIAARTMPSIRTVLRPVIDYLGVAFVALGTGALVLATSWGGTTYAWTSPTILGLFIGAVVALGIFVAVEQRATEPILPMRLFSGPVFRVSSILSFIVGFAMLGSLTFLPSYLQYVQGVSATSSGVRTLPMVVGLLGTSIFAGTLVGRTGRYKIFPVAGSVLLTVGLFLLSRMDETTSFWTTSLFMLVLGAGIGSSMQILTLIVQNTSDYKDLGVATSGVTFFRSLGSCFGGAVFGAIYANRLDDRLPAALADSPRVNPSAIATPEALHAFPAADIVAVVHAYAQAIQGTFLWAVPVGAVAFVFALVLKEVPLRGTARDVSTDLGEGFGMPGPRDSATSLQSAIGRLMRRDGREAIRHARTTSGTTLDVADGWCVAQVYLRARSQVGTALDDIADFVRVPAPVLRPAFERTRLDGYLSGGEDDAAPWVLTDDGHAQFELIAASLTDWLVERLELSGPDETVRVREAMRSIGDKALAEESGGTHALR
jgi:EmrB/QacA subfamily drug resistance transporter